MRHGYTEELAKRLEHQNSTARLMVEAVITTNEDVKDKKADWDGADSTVGMTTMADGGVKISGAVATLAENTTVTTTLNDLNNAAPWNVAMVQWDVVADIEHRMIETLTADLVNRRDGGQPGEVTFWRARLYRVAQIQPDNVFTLAPIGSHVDVAAGAFSTSSAEKTFDFTNAGGLGVEIGPRALVQNEDVTSVGQVGWPYTVVMITAMKGEGIAAGNVGWDADGGNQTLTDGNNNIITYESLTNVDDQTGVQSGISVFQFSVSQGNGIPVFALKGNTYTAKTIAFTSGGGGNDIDLGSAPLSTTDLRVTAQGDEFSDSTLTYQIDDGVAGMTTVVDGDVIGEDNTGTGGTDLSSIVRQQTYDIQVVLTPSTGGLVTPVVRRFGVSELTSQDLDGLSVIGESAHELDPVTLIANLPEVTITLLRDGLLDYRDAATDLLSDNYREALEFRIWVGHPDLARKDWLHIDDFVIDGQESAGPGIALKCVSPLAKSLINIPPKSGSTRSPLVYAAATLKSVYDDFLTAQITGFPGRRIGAVVEDAVTTVTKTIDGPVKAKTELDRIAYLAGGGSISSQGRIKFVTMFGDQGVSAIFPAELIQMISVNSGYEDRIPDIAVGYGWDNGTHENDFEDESYSSVTNAIDNFGRALIDREENLAEEIAKWIEDSTLGDVIADRITQNFAIGVPLFAFRLTEPYPYLEPGDAVVFETDRLVTRDPNTGLAYRGKLWALGRIVSARGMMGTDFTVWVRSFQDMLPTSAAVSRIAYAQTSEITGIEVTFDEEAEAVVSASGNVSTTNMYVTVGDGSAPLDPTVGTNDGVITGRTGSVATGVKVTTGNDAFVKVIGANVNADVGPVQSGILRRDLGLFHKDTTVRSHTGDTNETTLETITVPANALGTEGGMRITAYFDYDGTAAGKTIRIKFGGTTITSTGIGNTATLSNFDVLLFNDGATNAQDSRTVAHNDAAFGGLQTATAAIDTTSDADIVITGQLSNGADTVKLIMTLVEYIGRN